MKIITSDDTVNLVIEHLRESGPPEPGVVVDVLWEVDVIGTISPEGITVGEVLRTNLRLPRFDALMAALQCCDDPACQSSIVTAKLSTMNPETESIWLIRVVDESGTGPMFTYRYSRQQVQDLLDREGAGDDLSPEERT